MNYYAGLDVSMEKTAVCVVDQNGEIVSEHTAATEPKALYRCLAQTGLSFELVGFEAGPCSAWLYKGLLAAGLSVVCIDARHAHAALKAQNVKTDKNDARGLAHILRTGWFRESHVRSDDSAKRRVLLNARKTLLSKRLELENHMRGNLKVFGLKVGATTARLFEGRVRDLIGGDSELLSYIAPLLEVRAHIHQQVCELDKKVRL